MVITVVQMMSHTIAQQEAHMVEALASRRVYDGSSS